MAIDLEHDTLLRLAEVPAWLHGRGVRGTDGEPVGLSTVYGWVAAGKLETVRIGVTYTSVEALQLMAHRDGKMLGSGLPPRRREKVETRRQTKSRDEAHAKASAELDRDGW